MKNNSKAIITTCTYLALLWILLLCNTSCAEEEKGCRCRHDIIQLSENIVSVTVFVTNLDTGERVDSEYTISPVEEYNCEESTFGSTGFLERRFESCGSPFELRVHVPGCDKDENILITL